MRFLAFGGVADRLSQIASATAEGNGRGPAVRDALGFLNELADRMYIPGAAATPPLSPGDP